MQHSKGCLLKRGLEGLFCLLTPALQVFCVECCRFSRYPYHWCWSSESSDFSPANNVQNYKFHPHLSGFIFFLPDTQQVCMRSRIPVWSHGELLHFLLVQKYLYYTMWWGWPSSVRREESGGQKRSCRTRQRHWRDTVTCSDPLHWAVPCTTTRNKEMSHRRFSRLPSYADKPMHVRTANKVIEAHCK